MNIKFKQHGVSLLMGLVLLGILTLVSLALLQLSSVQERMGFGQKQRIQAFEISEIAQKQAVSVVAGFNVQTHAALTDCSAGVCPNGSGIDWRSSSDWSNSNKVVAMSTGLSSANGTKMVTPKLSFEYIPTIPNSGSASLFTPGYYVRSLGSAALSRHQVILETAVQTQ